MKVVKDTTGKEWLVTVTPIGLQRVKEGTQFDLASVILGEPLARFYNDLGLSIDVLYWLCHRQATEQGVTREQFCGDLWRGDAIEQAQEAILDELADFFPSRRGQALRQMVTTLRAQVEAGIQQITATASSTSATNSEASLESTPAT